MTRVKIVDDDQELANNTADILKSQGYEVSVCLSAKEALDELTNDIPDILILDVMFPDNPSAGFELAREIRNAEPIKQLPIIMLTGVNQHFPVGFSSDDIDPDWMPVQDFLEKPVDAMELIKKIEALLQKTG